MLLDNCCNHKALDARVSQESIGKLYNQKAKIYDLWANLTEKKARRRAVEIAEISNGDTILEVAVGTGLLFEQIVQRNPTGRNVGIDVSEGMLEKARSRLAKNNHNYSLHTASAYQLELENDSVDILFNNYMFDLIPYADFSQILSEFLRVLKPGGKLVMVNMARPESMLAGIYELIYRISPATMGGCRGVALKEHLLESGFDVTVREYYEEFLFPSEVILAYKKN